MRPSVTMMVQPFYLFFYTYLFLSVLFRAHDLKCCLLLGTDVFVRVWEFAQGLLLQCYTQTAVELKSFFTRWETQSRNKATTYSSVWYEITSKVGDFCPWLTIVIIYRKEILHVQLSGNNFIFQKGYLNIWTWAAELIRSVELMVYIYLPALFSSTLPMSGLTLVKKQTKRVSF